MGWFLACFGSSKDRRRKERSIRKAQPRVQTCPSFKPLHAQPRVSAETEVEPVPEFQSKDEQVSAKTVADPVHNSQCKDETFDSKLVETNNSEKSTQSQSSSEDRSVTSDSDSPMMLSEQKVNPQKENLTSDLSMSFSPQCKQSKSSSDCLVSTGSNSVARYDDRPILGALTIEEIRRFSASSSSPRKSSCRSPDDMPIPAKDCLGSASSYKGIPNTTSKYREDRKVSWHSTPFETRLERALQRSDAKAL